MILWYFVLQCKLHKPIAKHKFCLSCVCFQIYILFFQITFQLLATFVTLVPLVDCSAAVQTRNDLTQVRYPPVLILFLSVIVHVRLSLFFDFSLCRWKKSCVLPLRSLRILFFNLLIGTELRVPNENCTSVFRSVSSFSLLCLCI